MKIYHYSFLNNKNNWYNFSYNIYNSSFWSLASYTANLSIDFLNHYKVYHFRINDRYQLYYKFKFKYSEKVNSLLALKENILKEELKCQ
jgi:hypothetical protein